MPLTKGQKIASQRNLANARECISISIPLPPPFLLLTHSPHQLPQPCRTLQGRAKQRAAKFAESLGDGGPTVNEEEATARVNIFLAHVENICAPRLATDIDNLKTYPAKYLGRRVADAKWIASRGTRPGRPSPTAG